MVQIKINHQKITAPAGSTVLEVAQQLNLDIPTLCYQKDYGRYTSCMICVVEDKSSGKLLPSCSAPIQEGMDIETDNERIRKARQDTLNLLLSEHVGDCEAPCHRICPAYMNIPLMIRQIKEQKFDAAIRTIKHDIALPAVLGRICPAPCENGCNRKFFDNPVSICELKRFIADWDLKQVLPFTPLCQEKSGKQVAIVGAGPTGLSAAYYLSQKGHQCIIYDENEKPGGQLRYGVTEEKLPRSVLDAEIYQIARLGTKLVMKTKLGRDITFNTLRNKFEAVVIAIGATKSDFLQEGGIKCTPRGIQVNRKTFETNLPGVFAGGNALMEGKMAIRSAAHGKFISYSVDQFLRGEIISGPPQRFNSIMGKLKDGEVTEFIQNAWEGAQIKAKAGFEKGYSTTEAVQESRRCFHCDCRKPLSCKLRLYSQEYNANQSHYKTGERGKFKKILQHDLVIFEPGKCIKCGLCIRIAEKAGETLGLTFINRGFNVQVAVPFNDSMKKALKIVAEECVQACPTAALSKKNGEELLDK
jgi:ferredoxin